MGSRHDKTGKKAGAAEAPSSAVVVDHLGIANYVVDEKIRRSCLGPLLLGFLYLFSPNFGHNQVLHFTVTDVFSGDLYLYFDYT